MSPQELELKRRKILTDHGYDPDKYDFDTTTGEISPRSTAPAPQSATSAVGAFAASAASNIPEAVTGLGGAAAGAAVGSAIAPGPGTVIGGLVGGLGLPVMTEPLLKKFKESVYPQSFQDYTAQSAAEHPTAALAGNVASGLIGMKPSVGNIVTAGRGARSLISGVPWNSLSAAQKAALPGVAIGAGLGGGITAAEEYGRRGNVSDISPTDVAISTLGGSLLSEPNVVGRKVFGFHPTPGIDTGRSVPSDRTGMAPTSETPIPLPYRRLMGQLAEKQGAEMVDAPQVLTNDGTPVRGSYDPAQDELRRSLIQISESAGLHDTPPHELIHGVLLRLQQGSPGEKALATRALAAFGGDEEKLVQAAGEVFAGRFNGSEESLFRDLGSLVRDRFLRRGQPADYANILANTLQRQGSIGDITGRVPSLPAQTPQEPTPEPLPQEVTTALKNAGFGDLTEEQAGKLVDDLLEIIKKAPQSRTKEINKITSSISKLEQALTLTRPEQHPAIQQKITESKQRLMLLQNADKITQNIQEQWLGPSTAREPVPPPPPKPYSGPLIEQPLHEIKVESPRVKVDVLGERKVESSMTPVQKNLLRITTAERAQRAKAFAKARAEEGGELARQTEAPPVPVDPAELQNAIAQRQVRGPKTAKQPLELEGVEGRKLPMASEDEPEPSLLPKRDTELERWKAELRAEREELEQRKRGYGNAPISEGAKPTIEPGSGEARLIEGSQQHSGPVAEAERGYVEDAQRYYQPIGDEDSTKPRIVKAAVKISDNEIYTGRNHGEAYDGMIHKYGDYNPDNDTWPKAVEGFITSDGRFVDRHEGWKIAKSGGRVVTDTNGERYGLASEDLPNSDLRKYQRFGPTDDQRKQPKPRVGLNPLAGEAMKLEKGGVEHKEMAGTVRELFDAMRSFKGKYANPIIGAMETLPTASQQKLYEALVDERRLQQSLRGALNPDEQRAYDVVRSTLREMAQDQIAAGQPVWTASGKKRTRGIDPFYFPNVIDRGVHRILAEGQGTQAFADLRRDFIQHQIQGGVSQAEAEKRFARFQGTFARTPSTNHPFDFQAVRIQEGVGLPDSWIEKDPTRALRSYTSRFARDRASWDILEKNPTTMKRLGSSTYLGDQPIPAGTPGENLVKDPHLQRILADFTGKDVEDEPLIKGLTRLTSATIVGPLSKVADLVTSPFKAVAYTAPGHTLDVIKGLLASPEGYRNAFRTGLSRRGGLVVAQDILGFGEELNGKLINVAEALTKYSGSEQLELVSRGISQAMGEAIGATHQRLAANGDVKSQQLLRKLGVTATTSKEEVGTRFAQLLQGRYDATNLPHFVTHGKMSPLFGLLRWSVEQTNNFERFVVEPAMQGDFRPLVLSVFAGLTGGLLINEAREQVMGKKPYTATWAELEAGKDKPGFRDALTYKLLSAANVSGTVGIVSDLAKQTYEFATGRSAQGFRYPLVNSAGDVLSRAIAGVRAIGEGEDIGEVLPQMLGDILKNNVQVYRLVRNNLGRAGVAPEAQKEVQRANEVRDQSVWSRMEGKSQTVPTERPIDYRNISERRFEEAPLSEAARMVPSLVKRASTRAGGDVMELAKNLRQTATVKPYGMPSMTSAKPDFIRYYNWVRQTQGPEAANRLVQEYTRRSQEAEVKRKLIPQVNVGR